MSKERCTVILLAAGSGKRMQSKTAKQFIEINGRPLICYPLDTIERSEVIDDCILVTGAEDIPYVQTEIVDKYGYTKVKAIAAGGRERWESVAKGLQGEYQPGEYVFIHDGARAFVTEKIFKDTFEDVKKYKACVAAVRSKDTVKIADENGFVSATPNRKDVWIVQTPQVFERGLITQAYRIQMQLAAKHGFDSVTITDDATAVESICLQKIKFTESDYRNIKVTTPEDLEIAKIYLQEMAQKDV